MFCQNSESNIYNLMKYSIKYYVGLKCCERPIKLSLKCLICMADLDFCTNVFPGLK